MQPAPKARQAAAPKRRRRGGVSTVRFSEPDERTIALRAGAVYYGLRRGALLFAPCRGHCGHPARRTGAAAWLAPGETAGRASCPARTKRSKGDARRRKMRRCALVCCAAAVSAWAAIGLAEEPAAAPGADEPPAAAALGGVDGGHERQLEGVLELPGSGSRQPVVVVDEVERALLLDECGGGLSKGSVGSIHAIRKSTIGVARAGDPMDYQVVVPLDARLTLVSGRHQVQADARLAGAAPCRRRRARRGRGTAG